MFQAYLTDVAQEYKLYQIARFNSSVRKLEWNEDELKWHSTISIDGGKDAEYSTSYQIVSDFVISAIGQLCKPKGFDIPGLENFGGKVMHSARWDRGYSLAGKKVALVGTGKPSKRFAQLFLNDIRCNIRSDSSRNCSYCWTFDSMSTNSRIRYTPT